MSQVYLTSDIHDGHKNLYQFGRLGLPTDPLNCVENNRELIRTKWRAKKRDTVILLGDCVMAPDSVDFYKSLPGHKILILGNHDLERSKNTKLDELSDAFYKVMGSLSWKGYKLSHIPIHPLSLRGKKCLHGHIHTPEMDFMSGEHYDPNYVNVNMDVLLPRVGEIMILQKELVKYCEVARSKD